MGYQLLRVAAFVSLLYAGYALLCFLAQRVIMYPGRGIAAPDLGPGALAGVERLWLHTRFGRVESWFLAGRGEKSGRRRPVVLFFHGNGEIIDFLPEQVEELRSLGFAVLLAEYPGYGRSGGTPSEASITATALAAYDAIVQRPDVDPGRVIAFGRSLGGGAACALSLQRPLAALILQAPFTSTRPFARRMLLPPFLVRDVFDNRRALAAYPGPVLILHGRYDDIIPFRHGQELARVARRVRLVELACAHNDCPPDWQEFWRIIAQFLRGEGVVRGAVGGDRPLPQRTA